MEFLTVFCYAFLSVSAAVLAWFIGAFLYFKSQDEDGVGIYSALMVAYVISAISALLAAIAVRA